MKKSLAIIFITVSFIVLCSLGYWQVQRLAWKQNIIDKLDRAYHQADTQSDDVLDDLNKRPLDTIRYGTVKGRFLYDKEILVGPKPREGKIGYHVVTPFKTTTGKFILANRGWINIDKIQEIERSQPPGIVEIRGLFRAPDWNMFTPNNSPGNNVWTKLDIDQIAQEKDLPGASPFMLYIAESSKHFDPAILHEEKWYPRNKHRQYAIFWFFMAFILLVLAGLYFRKEKNVD